MLSMFFFNLKYFYYDFMILILKGFEKLGSLRGNCYLLDLLVVCSTATTNIPDACKQ